METLNAFGLIIVYLIKYYLVGTLTYKILRLEMLKRLSLRIVTGFLMYQALFFFCAIPSILCNLSLTVLAIIWDIIMVLILSVAIVDAKKIIGRDIVFLKKEVIGHYKIYLAVFIAIGIFVGLTMLFEQHGWDALGYLGITNTSYATDSMWKYYHLTGLENENFSIRRALSTYEINSAVCCKNYGINTTLEFRVVRRIINILLTTLCYWYFGKYIFKINKRRKDLSFFVIVSLYINLIFMGNDRTSAWFLIARTYEGKAFCANCIVLFLLILCIEIIKRHIKIKNLNLFVLLICCGAISVSASSMYLVVLIFLSILGAAFIVEKKINYVNTICFAMLPSILCMIIVMIENVGF